MVINFPTRLKYSKENPIVNFYEKCMKSAFNKGIDAVDVTAFCINVKDYSKLKKLLDKHLKINYPNLSFKKRKFEVGLILLDIGPRVSKKIDPGSVEIDEEKLYDNN
jgi:hypothetical protein